MAVQAVLIVLLSSVALSASQSCGTLNCTQEYDDDCKPDMSSALYDNCRTSQSNCTDPIGPADNLSVDCYETCIIGSPFDPTEPLQCCADSILEFENISHTIDPKFIIARLYSPNEPGMSIYRLNTYCKYNVQCPNENYALHYTMIRFDIEPPDDNGTCLDFLRFDFTATGASVPTDACGELQDLPAVLKSGIHGSGLTLDFRSNRINRTVDFFLAVICINTAPSRKRSVQSTSSATVLKETVDPNLQLAEPVPTIKSPITEGLGLPQKTDCIPSKSLSGSTVGRDVSDKMLTSAEEYLDHVFPRVRQLREVQRITVTRAGVVRYADNTIAVVERKGKALYKFENIKVLQVYNRIEGYLTFPGSSSPRGRSFPGYGFLQVGEGTAQYIQTLVDPRFLLSDEEVIIVRELFGELFSRQQFDAERFYFTPPSEKMQLRVNCDLNTLAELNSQSCSPVVRAVATFFLEKDTSQALCYSRG